MTPEANFQKELKAICEKYGCTYIKFSPGPYSPRGIPDSYLYKGRIGMWIETKIHPNKLTGLQLNNISNMPNAIAISKNIVTNQYTILQRSKHLDRLNTLCGSNFYDEGHKYGSLETLFCEFCFYCL